MTASKKPKKSTTDQEIADALNNIRKVKTNKEILDRLRKMTGDTQRYGKDKLKIKPA